MIRVFPVVVTVASALALSGCVQPLPGAVGVAAPATEPALAPPVPTGRHTHSSDAATTGINGDAIAGILRQGDRAYIYYDPIAANKSALAAAPAKLCASYGKGLVSSHVTVPADREPGVKVLAVDCR